ncbi:hypothetical protein D3C78_1632580 [compost metagenome]
MRRAPAVCQAVAGDAVKQQPQFLGVVRAVADQALHAVLGDVLGILGTNTAGAQESTQRRAFLTYECNEDVRNPR